MAHSYSEPLFQNIEVTPSEWQRRKEFVGFTQEDENLLAALHPVMAEQADNVMEKLYNQFLQFEETRKFFPNKSILEHVKSMQKEYFLSLTQGEYDESYLNYRLRIGRAHRKIGLEPRWYIGAYSIYVQLIFPRVISLYQSDALKIQHTCAALLKIFKLDIELAMTAYIAPVEEAVTRQAKEILELSTPVVEVWKGIIMVPLIGMLDSQRTEQFMERLLKCIVDTNSSVAVLDITGVPMVDTQTARHLIETISSVRLLGGRVVLTGVRPVIARTLVHLGIDLGEIVTSSSLSSGLQYAFDTLNLQVRAKGE